MFNRTYVHMWDRRSINYLQGGIYTEKMENAINGKVADLEKFNKDEHALFNHIQGGGVVQ